MTREELMKMTRNELLTKVDMYGLDEDVSKTANKPTEPTKSELASVILSFLEEQEKVHGTENKTEKKPKSKMNTRELLKYYGVKHIRQLPRNIKAKIQKQDLLRKECVIIVDNQNTQSSVPTFTVSWGNDLIGTYVDVIDLDNPEGQYVRRGALVNLKNAKFMSMKSQKVNANSGSDGAIITRRLPRFQVIPAEPLTQAQLEKLKVEQANKKSMEQNVL